MANRMQSPQRMRQQDAPLKTGHRSLTCKATQRIAVLLLSKIALPPPNTAFLNCAGINTKPCVRFSLSPPARHSHREPVETGCDRWWRTAHLGKGYCQLQQTPHAGHLHFSPAFIVFRLTAHWLPLRLKEKPAQRGLGAVRDGCMCVWV